MCGICHGETGDGNGYNARYLPVSPTAHSDSAYMSTRQDAALYDGIAAGGFVMNRSHAMPPFLETLTKSQIADLVKYMRKLV
ncbi:MAG: c-type cytochrome [Calditrichia bacterium]